MRIVDLLLVRRSPSGAVTHLTATDLGWEEAIELGEVIGTIAGFAAGGWQGADRGSLAGIAELMDGHLFDEDDAFRLEQIVGPDSAVAILLLEQLWAVPLLDAIGRANGLPLHDAIVAPETILAAGGAFAERLGDADEAV